MNHKHLDIKVTKICMQTVSDWVDQVLEFRQCHEGQHAHIWVFKCIPGPEIDFSTPLLFLRKLKILMAVGYLRHGDSQGYCCVIATGATQLEESVVYFPHPLL